MDDILAQRVIFGLDGLEVILQSVQLPHLLLEFLNVSFFALTKGPLRWRLRKLWVLLDDMRIDKAKRPSRTFNESSRLPPF
jgi:hypothetical protein